MRGECRVCHKEADSPNGTYCAEHRTLSTDGAPRARNVTPDAVADQLAANIEAQLAMAAMLWAIRDEVCANALAQAAPQIAEYWGGRARSSPAIARALENMTGAGGLLAGVAVHAPLLMVVFAHHVAPAIERRRGGVLHAVPDLEPEPGDVASPATFSDVPTGPTVIRDGAGWAEGTMPDAAGAAARAAAPESNGTIPLSPELLEQLGVTTFPEPGSDAHYAWEAAEAEAARLAAEGVPFGIATYDGVPVFAPAPADGA